MEQTFNVYYYDGDEKKVGSEGLSLLHAQVQAHVLKLAGYHAWVSTF